MRASVEEFKLPEAITYPLAWITDDTLSIIDVLHNNQSHNAHIRNPHLPRTVLEMNFEADLLSELLTSG
jgi:hypothetical protein